MYLLIANHAPRLILIVLLLTITWTAVPIAGPLRPPGTSVHWAEPIVTYPAMLDEDGNRILDRLDAELQRTDPPLSELIEVAVILYTKPGPEEIAAFESLGGELRAVWQYSTYGLWGRLPSERISEISHVFGERLCYVQRAGENDGHADMDLATQIVRVRNQVWITYGFTGDAEGSLAILDSGIDGAHNDLADPDQDNQFNDPDDWNNACVNGWNPSYRMQGWWNNYSTSGNPVDPNGHGTAVAGCAAGDGSNNSLLKGIALATHLVGYRIGEGTAHSSERAISAMDTVIMFKDCARIKTLNLSISYNPSNPTLIMDAATNVVRNGIVMVCSAGNQYHFGTCHPYYYVMYPNRNDMVITVGASTDNDQMAGFSSNGPPGVEKPDIVAPGGGLFTSGGTINTCDNNPDDLYEVRTGTSFAAPQVCGAASLLIDAWEQTDGFTWSWSELEALTIKSVLLMTACEIDTAGEDPGYSDYCDEDPPPNSPGLKDRGGHDPVEGYGRINVDAAVEALTMTLAPSVVASDYLGNSVGDKKVWARLIDMSGPCVHAVLEVPATADFDLYLYRVLPNSNGIPVILGSSVADINGNVEEASLDIGFISDQAFLVVKWVSGYGDFNVYFTDATTDNFLDITAPPLDDTQRSVGVAWGDYDNDDDLDLYVVNTGAANKLFNNQGDGTFLDATGYAGVGDGGDGRSAAWADYDNDGLLDLYVVNLGQHNKLYRNQGNGTFVDAAFPPVDDSGFGECAVWGDYDNDGWVDLYLVNNDANKLFRNLGSSGGWVDITSNANVGDTGLGKAAAWADFDNDGDLDLYVANFGANRLYQNNGNGTFSDAPDVPLGGSAASTQGMAWGDYDNDGYLDLYLVNYFDEANYLFHNDGPPSWTFTDVTSGPLGDTGDGIGATWADYDNDGRLDLYITNAHWNLPIVANKLLHNDGGGVFWQTIGTLLGDPADSYGAAWGDIDSDGDLDLYLANWSPDANRLFLNEACTYNHWFAVEAHGNTGVVRSNISAIGVRVRIVAGGTTQIREISGGSGYGQNSLVAHFGLGGTSIVDTLEIRWSEGTTYAATELEANQLYSVDQSTPVREFNSQPVALKLYPAMPNPFNPLTQIRFDLPVPALVDLGIYDISGRLVRQLMAGIAHEAGHHTLRWDGRDDKGRTVAAGVYFLRLDANEMTKMGKVVLVR